MASIDTDHLADSIDTASSDLIGELKGVRDSVEELYILLDHIWRNREELRDIMGELLDDRADEREENETVTCCLCNAVQPTLATAVRQGWVDFQTDDEAEDWRYVGVCGDCQRKQIEQARQRTPPPSAMEAAPERRRNETAEPASGALYPTDVEDEPSNEEIPETIACIYCDVDSPPSLAAARQEGWTRLERDDGSGWNYLGICPECQEEQREEDLPGPEPSPTKEQKHLFA